ncbi:MAG: hypothetical protein GF390_02700, partial [Candidatus Pacebacteria bacterium]|nr:hypothetical protein [Candidatus Paceibacterota bacterium]
MTPIVFNGYQFVKDFQPQLKKRVEALQAQGCQPHIAAFYFQEDAGSVLYTKKKAQAAQQLGIKYQTLSFAINTPVQQVLAQLRELNQQDQVTGIIIQKPTKTTYKSIKTSKSFTNWWQQLVKQIKLSKDVDGLHPKTLQSIKQGQWQSQGHVLPATTRAVLKILALAKQQLKLRSLAKVLILGRSDLLGKP